MNKIYIKQFWLLLLLVLIASCSPQELDKYSMNEVAALTDEQVTFTYKSSPSSDNMITFTNTTELPSNGVFTIRWDLGNGASGNKQTATGLYPFAGEYTVTLSIHSADGFIARKSVVMKFENDDYTLVDTPVYKNLTGGADNTKGKTWVFDQHNNFAKEVAAAGFKDIKGHMGLGPRGSRGQEWWGAAANDKDTWEMYSSKFTFTQDGVKLKIEKNGNTGYGRAASAASIGGYKVTSTVGEDVHFDYSGGDYTFSIDESGDYPLLTVSGNGFMGYYCGSQVYEILYQTDKVMALRVDNVTEGQDWVFVYCIEELNKEPELPPKELKAIPLSDDFEVEEKFLDLVKEDMGDVSRVVDNPVMLPINTSDKVYRYWKSDKFYSNLSLTASDYKFDLSKQNIITLKVYIPSYNDYVTENASEAWITEKKLRRQLAIKLQDSEHGSPWETQVEIVKGDLETDKWIELKFDFSSDANREDLDRIVIQFGGEGHGGSGYFFFDDFKFSE